MKYIALIIFSFLCNQQVLNSRSCIEQTIEQAYNNADIVADATVLSEREVLCYPNEAPPQTVAVKGGTTAAQNTGYNPYENCIRTAHEYVLKLHKVYKGDVHCDTLRLCIPWHLRCGKQIGMTSADYNLEVGAHMIFYCSKDGEHIYAPANDEKLRETKFEKKMLDWTTGACSRPTVKEGTQEDAELMKLCKKAVEITPCSSTTKGK